MKQLEGLLATQPLWTGKQFGLTQFTLPKIDKQYFPSIALPTNLRLGHQVEYFLLHVLKSHPDYEVLAHSIQIKKGNVTKGELDFLLRFCGSILHLELSYKFYLIDPSILEPIYRLVGPNKKDMFFIKLEKTRTQQLPQLHSALCIPILEQMDLVATQIEQQVCFLGQLFMPVSQITPSIRPLNKKCIVGYWMALQEFEKPNYISSSYYIPNKNEWLHIPHQAVTWQSHFNSLLEITIRHIRKESPMLWRKLPDGTIDKIFVVWW